MAQRDGFAELCGLQAFKPFECVGEVEESALLLKKLSDMPEWQDDAVVKDLAPRLPPLSLRHDDLFSVKDPHAVPARLSGDASMRVRDLTNKKIVIWGTGREGQAAADFLAGLNPVFVDESATAQAGVITAPEEIKKTLEAADVVIKSPGVSLYHPLVKALKAKGTPVTSLLNLWLAEPHTATTICVTGTKGKSTTSALLAHVLKALGQRVALAGNIGLPISTITPGEFDIVVIETSSFQAADLVEQCDIAVMTSLYEDHIDWHGSRVVYHGDKLNLLRHAKIRIISQQANSVVTIYPT